MARLCELLMVVRLPQASPGSQFPFFGLLGSSGGAERIPGELNLPQGRGKLQLADPRSQVPILPISVTPSASALS